MKKRWMLLILVVLTALIAAAPALAAGPGNQNRQENQHRYGVGVPQLHNGQNFTLTGTITVLGADSITVLIRNGNHLIKPYIGQELVVQVTESTRYRQWTPEGCVPITFEDLEVGDTTSIQGTVSEEVFTAARVTVDVPCCTP